jgi:hypothetical protein
VITLPSFQTQVNWNYYLNLKGILMQIPFVFSMVALLSGIFTFVFWKLGNGKHSANDAI